MAKRLTDTEKYKKPFIRGLKGPYKLLWDYLYHNCDHAGIWIVDFEITQIYIGNDMPINHDDALKYFNDGKQRVITVCDGKKWFIPGFIEIQYGVLNESNRVHKSVINILKKYNLLKFLNKPLISPLYGAKDKDKVKDKDKDKDKDRILLTRLDNIDPLMGEVFLRWLKYKRSRGESYKTKDSTQLAYKKLIRLSQDNTHMAKLTIEQSMENNWAGLFELKQESSHKPRSAKIEAHGQVYVLGDDGEYRTTSGELYLN